MAQIFFCHPWPIKGASRLSRSSTTTKDRDDVRRDVCCPELFFASLRALRCNELEHISNASGGCAHKSTNHMTIFFVRVPDCDRAGTPGAIAMHAKLDSGSGFPD